MRPLIAEKSAQRLTKWKCAQVLTGFLAVVLYVSRILRIIFEQARHAHSSRRTEIAITIGGCQSTSQKTRLSFVRVTPHDLRRRLRSYRTTHVICDNAKFHKSKSVRNHLAKWGHRLKIHFLPTRAPQINPIERVWWRFHQTITRNHRCRTIKELLAKRTNDLNISDAFS